MKYRLTYLLCLLTLTSNAIGSDDSDQPGDGYRYRHDYLPTSSESEWEEFLTVSAQKKQLKMTREQVEALDEKAFREECEGIKLPEKAKPFEVAKSVALRVSSFYQGKLRWILRRVGTDFGLDIYVKSYGGSLPVADLEELKGRVPKRSMSKLARLLVDAYLTGYFCEDKFQSKSLIHVLDDESLYSNRDADGQYVYWPIRPTAPYTAKLGSFVTALIPQLRGSYNEVDCTDREVFLWQAFAWEKAAILFLRDFIQALENKETVSRLPFEGLEVPTIIGLYAEVKPDFLFKRKPKDVPGTTWVVADPMESDTMPYMNKLMGGGVRHYNLEPADPAPDEPGADEEDLRPSSEELMDPTRVGGDSSE